MENMETIAWEALVEAEGQIARISLLTMYTVIARPLLPRQLLGVMTGAGRSSDD